jgi:hypothetical protein
VSTINSSPEPAFIEITFIRRFNYLMTKYYENRTGVCVKMEIY